MAATNITGTSSEVFDPWLASRHWADSVITYSFPTDGTFISYQSTSSVTALNVTQQNAVRQVLSEISSFTGLSFTEVTESAGTEATMRFAREVGLGGAYAYLPDSDEQAGDSYYGGGTSNPIIGNEAYLFFTHEIGHTMGLNHGHEYSAFVNSGLDSQEYTVVTYTDYVGDTDTFEYDSGPVDWAQSYMQLDIAALQFLYGANYSVAGEDWSGNTVYTFDPLTGEMSINDVGVGTPAGNRIFRTIWDGDGTDTYDLSNYSTNLQISLSPGEWSTFSDSQLADLNRHNADPIYLAEGNLANARLVDGDLRALIENATGGSGNDGIRGNEVNNTLQGNAGNDRLLGMAGDDQLLGDAGWDKIYGAAGDDLIYGGANVDTLSGGGGADQLFGENGADTLLGGNGMDMLFGQNGYDELRGGQGRDVLNGGAGVDVLYGGGQRDIFEFTSVSDSSFASGGDTIMDFEIGLDWIDLSDLSSGTLSLSLNVIPKLNGASGSANVGLGDTEVLVDVDGDGQADFRLIVQDVTGLTTDDFLL